MAIRSSFMAFQNTKSSGVSQGIQIHGFLSMKFD